MDSTKVILGIVGIGVLVAFHELGHHLVALWCGMRVRRFSVGFGPALLKKTHHGIDYTLGAIPLGGFVDIVGMNPMEEGTAEDPRAFHNRPKWARALVLAAGPGFNYVMAFALLVGVFWLGGLKQDLNFTVKEVIPNGAAQQAGLQVGDVILKVEDRTLHQDADLLELVGAHEGVPLELVVQRGEQTLTLKPVPAAASPGEPARLNIKFEHKAVGEAQNYSLPDSMVRSAMFVAYVSSGILSQLGDLMHRVMQPGQNALEDLRGPPAIVEQLGSSENLTEFIRMLAILSVMLGLMNLLPIPPLDGSKLVFLGAEAVARRAIPARAQIYIHGVGFVFMFGLMLLVSVKDVLRKPPEKAPAAAVEPAAVPAR